MTKINAGITLAFLTTVFSIYPTVNAYAQEINSYENFQLYCSKEAFYYKIHSPECERYWGAETPADVVKIIEKDREFQHLYFRQVEELNNVLKLAKQAQSIEQLQQKRNHLNTIVLLLETFPVDVKVYPTVQQTLTVVQRQLNQFDDWLAKERQSAQQFTQVQQLIDEATKQTEAATTISQYQLAKANWEEINKQLELIPPGVFVAEDVKTWLAQVSEQENRIQAQINHLVAEEKRRQEEIARQEAARQEAARQEAARQEAERREAARREAVRQSSGSIITFKVDNPSPSCADKDCRPVGMQANCETKKSRIYDNGTVLDWERSEIALAVCAGHSSINVSGRKYQIYYEEATQQQVINQSTNVISIQTDALGPEALQVEVRCNSPSGGSESRINDPDIGTNNWESTPISIAYCSGRSTFNLDGMSWRIIK